MKNTFSTLLLVATVAFSACESKEKSTPVPTPPPAPTEFGFMRIVNNLTPTGNSFLDNANNAHLQLYDQRLGNPVRMGESAMFTQVPIGAPFVVVSFVDDAQRIYGALSQGQIKVEKNQFYSFFTFYTNPRYINGVKQVLMVKEPNRLTPIAGKAYVRVLNLSTEAFPVKIEEPFGETLYPLVEDREVTDYQLIDGRSYTLKVSRTTGDKRELFTQSITLPSELQCSLVIRGSSEKDAQGRSKIGFDLIYD